MFNILEYLIRSLQYSVKTLVCSYSFNMKWLVMGLEYS